MRAFYRFLAPLPETGLPSGVVLFQDEAFVWVLAERSPAPELEALGGQLRGTRLSELQGGDLDACAVVTVQRVDPETGDAMACDVTPSAVLPSDLVLAALHPRTVFAGDALEAYA